MEVSSMEEEKKHEFKRMLLKKHPFLEQFTDDEVYLMGDILNWGIEDKKNVEFGCEVVSKALEGVSTENVRLWLQLIKDALNGLDDKNIVYPNAIGFLLKEKQDYEKELRINEQTSNS